MDNIINQYRGLKRIFKAKDITKRPPDLGGTKQDIPEAGEKPLTLGEKEIDESRAE